MNGIKDVFGKLSLPNAKHLFTSFAKQRKLRTVLDPPIRNFGTAHTSDGRLFKPSPHEGGNYMTHAQRLCLTSAYVCPPHFQRGVWLPPDRRKWLPFKPALTHDQLATGQRIRTLSVSSQNPHFCRIQRFRSNAELARVSMLFLSDLQSRSL